VSDPDLENVATVDGLQWSVASGRPALSFPIQELVVTEEPLEIRLCHAGRCETVSVTMRTPTEDEHLAAGFLFTEGIVTDRHEIDRIESHRAQGDHIVDVHTRHPVEVDPALKRQFLTNSSCGVCGRALVQGLFAERGGPVQSDLRVSAKRLVEMPKTLRSAQRLFDRTGGLHAAGLFDASGQLLRVAEDIGRHNAVDKVIGARFLDGNTPDAHAILQVSGRVSFEIVQKAGAAGIPVVSAVSAPSSLAVSAADRLGITLAAFVREDRMNVYSHPERLVDPPASSPG
jgi:FdhD protein